MTEQQNSGMGELIIRASGGGGAFPIEGAVVTVSGREQDGVSGVIYSLRTDESGLTPRVGLPAPSGSLSLRPGVGIQPYSVYDIKVTKNGYEDSENASVQIFDGITALQYFNMIPQISGSPKRTNSSLPPAEDEYPQLKEVTENDL